MKSITVDGVEYVEKKEVPKNKKGLEYCIVRTYSAGVFAGYYDRTTKGEEGIVYEARRLWYWDGAASLSQLATDGVSKPENCKFPCEIEEVTLKNIVEATPCTKKSQKSINSVSIWKK